MLIGLLNEKKSLMSQNVDETEEYELEEKSAVASSTTAPAASNTATTSETKQNHTAQQAPRLSLIESNSSASQEVSSLCYFKNPYKLSLLRSCLESWIVSGFL